MPPPCITDVIDGARIVDGLPAWGPLPDMVIQTSFTVKVAAIEQTKDSSGRARVFKDFRLHPNKTVPHIKGAKLGALYRTFVDMSALYPDFAEASETYHTMPSITLGYMIEPGYDEFGVFDFLALDRNRTTGAVTDFNNKLQVMVNAGMCTAVDVLIKKSYVPAGRLYLGVESLSSILDTDWEFVEGSRREVPKGHEACEHPELVKFRFVVPKPLVMRVVPASILEQVGRLTSDMGGYLTMLTSVFFIFFTRKHNEYPFEAHVRKLTCRGCSDSSSKDPPFFELHELKVEQ